MNKLQKALARLSLKEKNQIKVILKLLNANNLTGLNITKLKGHDDIFRVRKGNLRVIYRIKRTSIFVLTIERRSEKTYRGY